MGATRNQLIEHDMKLPVNISRDGPILTIEIDNPPVNASSQRVRQGLMEGLLGARADASVEAVILCAAGRTFMAGADITEFDLPAVPQPDPNEVFDAVEALGRPVIAALHGTVLGGGLELALAAHYRIALASTKLGLPEVKLGVLPGAGGTQRLPRVAGIQAALDMMTSGVSVGAGTALKLGILDAVVESDLRQHAVAMAHRLIAERKPLRLASRLAADTSTVGPGFFDDYRRKLPAVGKGGRAAHEIVRCVQAAVDLPFPEALRLERAAFEDLRNSAESAALRHIFFAEREATRIPGLPRDVKLRSIHKVGVVGAGTMGGGIAMTFANAGFPVSLVEVRQEALERGMAAIRNSYEATAAKGRMTAADVRQRVGLIQGSLDDSALADCDLVIEAAYEDLEIKRSICSRLGKVCKPDAIIASNTSTLDIDVLAEASGRPGDMVGMHFFSPAHVMKLLEVVRGAKTSPEVLATVLSIAKTIGKAAVVSGVCYGFIGNRMLESYLRETEYLLMEGASPSQIDSAIEAFGMAMGPCRMIDMAGVDVAAKVVLERQKGGGLPDDPAYRAVVRRLHELGRFGQKTSSGYYRYEGRTAIEDPQVADICRGLAQAHGIVQRDEISDAEIVERCLFPLINEGQQILEEGIAYRPGDIDVVWVQGYGFPAHKGGPMHAAGVIGAAVIRDRLAAYGSSRGNAHGYWTVSPRLSRLADEEDQRFADAART